MPSWTALPVELRGEIVKRLDFRTRFRFRHVSKTNQELVDSVPLFIPLVALSVKNKTEAILTFYTGIEKWIQVEYVGDGEGKTSVKVKETSNSTVTQHGAIRQVTTPNPLILALSAFKHVAMNPNTLSGGIDLKSTNHIKFKTALETEAFFGGRKFRTKVFYESDNECYDLAMHISTGELEEYREVDVTRDCRVNTWTRRLTARITKEDETKWNADLGFSWPQTYVFPTEQDMKLLMASYSSSYHAPMPGVHVEKVGVVGYFVHNTTENKHLFEMITPCGHASWFTPSDVKIENPSNGCWMRWACPKHADPFDHWYMFKIAKINDYPRTTDDDTCSEFVWPIVNGKCSLEAHQKDLAERAKLDQRIEARENEVAMLSAKIATLEQEQLDAAFAAELARIEWEEEQALIDREAALLAELALLEQEEQQALNNNEDPRLKSELERIEREEREANDMFVAITDGVGQIMAMHPPRKPDKKWPFFVLVGFFSVGFALVGAIIVAACVI